MTKRPVPYRSVDKMKEGTQELCQDVPSDEQNEFFLSCSQNRTPHACSEAAAMPSWSSGGLKSLPGTGPHPHWNRDLISPCNVDAYQVNCTSNLI